MIPSDFNNHVPNETGRALHEQCMKSMKDFFNPRREVPEEFLRTCFICKCKYDMHTMREIKKRRKTPRYGHKVEYETIRICQGCDHE